MDDALINPKRILTVAWSIKNHQTTHLSAWTLRCVEHRLFNSPDNTFSDRGSICDKIGIRDTAITESTVTCSTMTTAKHVWKVT